MSRLSREEGSVSSGKLKVHRGFNKTQIKDGWIVRLRKDGTIAAKLGKYGEKKVGVRNY